MDVVIFGAGGLGREIYDTLLTLNSINLDQSASFQIRGFIDEFKPPGTSINGVPVLGGAEVLSQLRGKVGVIIGIADTHVRKRLHEQYGDAHFFPNIIHPTALVSDFATLGEAILIQAQCIVASNASLGDGVMMNAHSGVGHDARVEDYCSIMSYCDLAGGSRLGTLSFVGTGAKVIPSTTIAPESYLCAGAIVFRDVLKKSKLMGNPAKIIG